MRCGHVDRKGRACLRGFHSDPIHVYTRLAQIGSRKKRTIASERLFKQALVDRSDGWCEASQWLSAETKLKICGTVILHSGTDPHHQFPEDRDLGMHDPARGLWICRRAHDWIHAHPAHARYLALLRPETDHVEA